MVETSVNRDVAFVVFDDALGPVFGSLYVKPAVLYQNHGFRSRVVAFSRLGEFVRSHLRSNWHKRLEEFSSVCENRIYRWLLPPSRLSYGIVDTLCIASWLVLSGFRKRPVVLHCGGALAAYHCIKASRLIGATNVKIIMHSWGPLAEEYAYGVTGRPDGKLDVVQRKKFDNLKSIEEFAYRKSQAVVVISDAMRSHARKIQETCSRKPVVVKIPCCVDAKAFSRGCEVRDQIRCKLRLQDRIVFAFVGSLHTWQRPDAIIQLFGHIHRKNPAAVLLMLTNQGDKAVSLCKERGISRESVVVKSVQFDEVPDFLAASDFGLMGRGLFEQPSNVNTFSSPIKIPEYLATGCPVILGSDVGDFSAEIRKNRLGVVADPGDDAKSFSEKIQCCLGELTSPNTRERCKRYVRERFDLETNMFHFTNLASQLLTESD
jgi:glycosyltransferase involved in cell wall biosynthesis